MKEKKAAGFYAGLLAALLCIVSGILYRIDFMSIVYKEQVYDSSVVVYLIVAGAAAAVMLFIRRVDGFAPVVLLIASGVSLLMFIHMMIWPISDTIYGIEPFGYMTEIYLCGGLILASFIVSEAALYLKKTRAPKARTDAEPADQ